MTWNDPRTDELLDIASRATDDDVKFEAVREIQEIVAEAGIYLPIVNVRQFLGASAEVRDLRANGQYLLSFGKLLDVWLDE